MTDKSKKIWKGVGITALVLGAIWVIGRLITNKWNPFAWFTSMKEEEKEESSSDCKTSDGKNGKKDSTGNCIAISERKICTGDCQGISSGGVAGYAQACCKNNSRIKGTLYDVNGNNLDNETKAKKCAPPCKLTPYAPISGTYTCDCAQL